MPANLNGARNPLLLAAAGLIAFLLLLRGWPTAGHATSLLAQAEPVLSVAGHAANTYPGQETTYWIELVNHTDQIPETTGLGRVAPVDLSVYTLRAGTDLSSVSQIIAGQTGAIFTLEPTARQVRIYR